MLDVSFSFEMCFKIITWKRLYLFILICLIRIYCRGTEAHRLVPHSIVIKHGVFGGDVEEGLQAEREQSTQDPQAPMVS